MDFGEKNHAALLLALEHGPQNFQPHLRLLCKEIAYTKINYLAKVSFRPPILKYFWEDMQTFLSAQCRIFPKRLSLICSSLLDLQEYPLLADNLQELIFYPMTYRYDISPGIDTLMSQIKNRRHNLKYEIAQQADFIRDKLGHLDYLFIGSDFGDISLLSKIKRLDISNSRVLDASKLNQITDLKITTTDINDLDPLISSASKIKTLALVTVKILPEQAECCVLLKDLSAFNCSIKELRLSFVQIHDISPLFTPNNQIEILDLSDNPITDISPMRNSKLKKLNLSATHISDVSLLATLTNLQELNLTQTRISDASMLNKIAKVSLRETDVIDVSAFGAPDSLTQELVLAWSEVVDVSALGKLKKLDLSGTRVTDVSALGRVYDLNLSCCNISFGLYKLVSVQMLNLNSTTIENCVMKFNHMKYLNLNQTCIDNIGEINYIKKLNLSLTSIKDISSLLNVEELDISSTDIRKLPYLPNLTSLDMSDCHMNDSCGLILLTNLEKLDIASTPITDISTLTKLQILALYEHNMDLSHLKNLRAISLGKSQVTGLHQLHRIEIIYAESPDDLTEIKNGFSHLTKQHTEA
jgi:Leucine-rich repeat (LRR) protein